MTGAGPLADAPTVLVTAIGIAEGARPAAAALACAGADAGRTALLVDVGGRPPRPTLLASAAARALEERLAAHLPRVRVAARGQTCHVAVAADPEGLEAASAAVTVARGALAAVYLPSALVRTALDEGQGPRFSAALLRADLTTDRALLAMVVRDLCRRDLTVGVLKSRLAWVAERRALFGTLAPGGSGGLPDSLVRRLAEPGLSTGTGKEREPGTELVEAAAGEPR
jgi:hypothetical protein